MWICQQHAKQEEKRKRQAQRKGSRIKWRRRRQRFLRRGEERRIERCMCLMVILAFVLHAFFFEGREEGSRGRGEGGGGEEELCSLSLSLSLSPSLSHPSASHHFNFLSSPISIHPCIFWFSFSFSYREVRREEGGRCLSQVLSFGN